MSEKRINKKEFDNNLKELGKKDKLSDKDENILKKAGFKMEVLSLFNWYRKAQYLINCRKDRIVLNNSVNLNGFKTSVKESQDYCKERFCKNCIKRVEYLFNDDRK